MDTEMTCYASFAEVTEDCLLYTSKFRTCLYAHCPYKKQVNVFRSTPEKWDILYARKKADKNRRP